MSSFRQITLQAPATNTTQNYTVSGFGTPQAADIMSSWSSDSSWKNDGNIGFGFWDGTDQNVAGAGWEDEGTPGSSNTRHYSDSSNCVWTIVVGASANKRKASITNTVTDGVEITWTGDDPSTTRPYVTVTLINGINGAKTGHRTASKSVDGTTQTTTSGITPKLVQFSGRRSDTATGSSSEPGFFMGYACDNGSSIDQGVVAWRNRDQDPTDCNGTISNAYCITSDVSTGGFLNGEIEMTTMTSGSFTTTTRDNVPVVSSHFYLALDFDESVVGWDAGTPTSSGDWDPFTAGFAPQWTFMFPTAFEAINTAYGSSESGVESMHIYSANDNGEEDSHSMTMENGSTGAGNMFAQSRYDNRFEINDVSATPTSINLVNGNSPTFDSTGIVFADANFSHDAGDAHQVIGFFVGTATNLGGHGLGRGIARGIGRGIG